MNNLSIIVLGVLIAVSVFLLFLSIKVADEYKKEAQKKDLQISKLKEKLRKQVLKNKKLAMDNELLKELIFFTQMGSEPTEEEKRRLMSSFVDDMKIISDWNSQNAFFHTEDAIRMYSILNPIGSHLRSVLENLFNVLRNSISNKKDLYSYLSTYIRYCGLSFCGKSVEKKENIHETSKLDNCGQIEIGIPNLIKKQS